MNDTIYSYTFYELESYFQTIGEPSSGPSKSFSGSIRNAPPLFWR